MLVTRYLAKDLFNGKTVFVTVAAAVSISSSEELRGLGRQLWRFAPHPGKGLKRSGGQALCASAPRSVQSLPMWRIRGLEKAFARSAAELVHGRAGVPELPVIFWCTTETLSPNGFKSVIDIDLLGFVSTPRGRHSSSCGRPRAPSSTFRRHGLHAARFPGARGRGEGPAHCVAWLVSRPRTRHSIECPRPSEENRG